ncbi:hypothetical protein HK102_000499 [Quaeritorhiza haematococci]|nr:hypothetical protein HK102_000499 [Quaeritorhiza haematococci]
MISLPISSRITDHEKIEKTNEDLTMNISSSTIPQPAAVAAATNIDDGALQQQKTPSSTKGFKWDANRLAAAGKPECFFLPDPASLITKLEFLVTQDTLAPFCGVLPRMQPCLKQLLLVVACSYRRLLESIVDPCPKNVKHLHLESFESDSTATAMQEIDERVNTHPLDVAKLGEFLSQFVEVLWVDGQPPVDLVISSTHSSLRSAELPAGLSEDKIGQFITSCSSAIAVADFTNIMMSEDNLLLLGKTCPRLRAFFANLPEVSDAAFETFLTMVGGTLEFT